MVDIFKILENEKTVTIKNSFRQTVKFVSMKYGKADKVKVGSEKVEFEILGKTVEIVGMDNQKIKIEKVEKKMTNEKIYFTEVEALESIKEVLESGYNGYTCDLHHEIFNTDYYIIGTYKAKKALEQYGVFEAIETIQEYEKNNFGEILTDLSDAEKVANMLWYIVGEKALSDLNSNMLDEYWDDILEEEQANKIIDDIERQIDRLK